MKSSFPKRVKRHSRKWACNVNAKLIDYACEKSFSHRCHMHIYVHIYQALFQNMVSNLGVGIANSIFGLALIAFWIGAYRVLHFLGILLNATFFHRFENLS